MSKKRIGFVSNSSSSSFIICGQELKALPESYDPKLYACGDNANEGEDFFNITPEMYAVICNNRQIRDDLNYYIVEKMIDIDNNICTVEDLPKNCRVYSKSISYDECVDVEDLESRYGE
jgi:hypothetical protein